MRMPRRLKCWIAGGIIGAAVIAPQLQMLLDRREVLTLDARASHIAPNPAKPGDTITITWRASPIRNCAGVVIPRVIDSTGRIYEFARTPTVYQDLMRPGDREFTKLLTLPTVMAPGPARYEAVVIRWCNVLQEWLWPMVDKPFPIPFVVAKDNCPPEWQCNGRPETNNPRCCA